MGVERLGERAVSGLAHAAGLARRQIGALGAAYLIWDVGGRTVEPHTDAARGSAIGLAAS
jgi:hypothetical protein